MQRTLFYLIFLAFTWAIPQQQAHGQCVAELEILQTFCSNNVGGVELFVQMPRPNLQASGWSLGDATVVYPFDTTVLLGPFFGQPIILQPLILGTNCESSPVTFVNNCINNNCPLQLFVTDTTWADCGQANGSITFEVVGAQEPYQIVWSGGGQSGGVMNTNVIDGLAGGTQYFFELIDATDFCTGIASYFLPNGTDLVIDISREFTCNEVILTAALSGGTPPYTYTWTNGVNTPQQVVAEVGIYTLVVTDAAGCSASATVSVDQLGGISLSPNNTFVIPASCGFANGAIFINPVGGLPPYTFAWSDGMTTQNRDNTPAGTYEVTITDANGCTLSSTFDVWDNNELELFIEPFLPRICNNEPVVLTATVINDLPFVNYEWRDENGNVLSDSQLLTVNTAGIYRVLVSSGSCTIEESVVVGDQSFGAEIVFNNFSNDSLGCFAQLFFSTTTNAGFPTTWTLPDGSSVFAFSVDANQYGPGLYIATLTPPNALCSYIDSILILPEDLSCGNLNGLVYLDESLDCNRQNDEIPLGGQLIRIRGVDVPEREYFAYTSFATSNTSAGAGTWSIALPSGQYTVELIAPNELFDACATNQVFTVTADAVLPAIDLGLQADPELACPRVTVDVNVPLIRRCFNSPVWVRYENTGAVVAENTLITVTVDEFADGVFSFNGQTPSSIVQDPITGIFTLTWAIGDLAPFAGGLLSFMVYTCNPDAPLGAAACITATAEPNNPCPPADPNWTGASLRVTGECQGDSVVFRLRNVGDADMSIDLSYIVVEDGVIITPVPTTSDPLGALQATEVSLPANGSTYHLRAMQEPLHPGLLMPIDFVEGCGGSPNDQTSLGFALQFPVSDDAYWIDTDCQPIIGAYDPNDKLAEPRGYASENYIEANQPIDYTIRFQNTGTDTAFLVVIRDTLSPLLDLSTLQVLSSSHPMELKIDSSHALAFIYQDILLVDSFTNEPGSHGAVSFRIHPKAGLAPGTLVENTAHIYFDFNEAVVTNTYRHTIEEDFVVVGLFDFRPSVENIRVYPNPTQGPARLILPAALQNEQLAVEVIDALGRPQSQYQYGQGQDAALDISHLPAGLYTLRLSKNGQAFGVGRLLLQRP